MKHKTALFLALFASTVPALAAPPANDAFANRTLISGGLPASVTSTNSEGTKEVGEPNHAGFSGGRSVWYTLTAPATGEISVAVDSLTPGFSPVTAIYTGSSVNALTLAGAASFGPASFNAVAGTTYHIAVDGTGTSPGNFRLNIGSPVAAASNDNFANRITISGTSAHAGGFNNGASKEVGEPSHAGNTGGKSVWYTWTAPSTGSYSAHLLGPAPFSDRILAVYTGSSVNALTGVGSASGGYTFPTTFNFSATAGTAYQIAVDGSNYGNGPASGKFVVNISQSPVNDAFANAINLGSAASGSHSTAWVDFATTMEFGEPGAPFFPNLSGPRTTWWRWTAPSSGLFNVDLLGSNFDTWLQIYSGTALNNLVLVGESHDADLQGRSKTAINVTSGTTYYFRVRGETPFDVGNVTLAWAPLGAASTADDYVALGRANLQLQTDAGLSNADTHFASALALNANHPEANLLKAITTFALLEQAAAFQNVLTTLGITDSNIYLRRYKIRKNAQGKREPLAPTGNSAVGVNYLGDTMLPALTVVRAHLDKVTSPSFVMALTDSETKDQLVLLDAGDIALIRAASYGLEAVIRLLQTYNSGVDVATAITAANNKTLTVKNVADTFSNLLTFTGNDQRAAFKTAVQSANTAYQAGSAFVRTTRAVQNDERHLFFLDDTLRAEEAEEEIRNGLQETSNSLNGATNVGGETVNLAQAITSTKSLREQLIGLIANKGIASTAPDPTFDGVLPNSTQAKVNRFLNRSGLLYEISNFSSWAAAFLSGQTVPNQAKSADPDKDMLTNFAEYAFNLNPGKSSATQEYSVNSLQTNVSDGKKYLNFSFVRRINRTTIDYVVAVSDNLTTWDRTGTQIQQVGAATANADGVTETVTVRLLADPLVTSRKFVRLEVSDLNP